MKIFNIFKKKQDNFNTKYKKEILDNDYEVNFEDINLEIYIKKIVENNIDKIFLSDIYNISKLDFRSWPLISIKGIQHLVNLQILNLYGSKMNNISYLGELNNLEELNISWADNISEINTLKKLKKLKSLKAFYSSGIKDFSPIESIITLEKLDISQNTLSRGDFLKSLINLNDLSISKNNLTDINFLENCLKLEILDISGNNITNIEILSKFKNLVKLDISANNITNIDSLLTLPNLKYLDLRGNDIIDNKAILKLKENRCKLVNWRK